MRRRVTGRWLHNEPNRVLALIGDEDYDCVLGMVVPPSNPVFSTKALISDLRLHTVCESAQCPNRWECWSQGTATFMIAGDRCTRACGFCAVTTAKPFALEDDEPKRVAEAV
ncbi:MAG TPA: hypothetical protein VL136_05030, partial [Candidatus Babeliales bacterium]|nr:hypothetical protein [Candidatus Babeliales bacterium]